MNSGTGVTGSAILGRGWRTTRKGLCRKGFLPSVTAGTAGTASPLRDTEAGNIRVLHEHHEHRTCQGLHRKCRPSVPGVPKASFSIFANDLARYGSPSGKSGSPGAAGFAWPSWPSPSLIPQKGPPHNTPLSADLAPKPLIALANSRELAPEARERARGGAWKGLVVAAGAPGAAWAADTAANPATRAVPAVWATSTPTNPRSQHVQ
jgi:hypothetical protein